MADCTQAQSLTADIPAEYLLADRGYNNNANIAEADSFDRRYDNKGMEFLIDCGITFRGKVIAIGRLNGRTYAFLGLERAGCITIFDVTYPTQARIISYFNNVNPEGDQETGTAGDGGREGMEFVPASASPNGMPLLLDASEVCGNTTIFRIEVGR